MVSGGKDTKKRGQNKIYSRFFVPLHRERDKNDEEDNALNQQFNEFPSIVLLPKEKKQKLQYIIKEKLSIKTPSEIKAIMEKFKWNIDDAISDLVV